MRLCLSLLVLASAFAVVAEDAKPLALNGLDPVRLVEGAEVAGRNDLTADDERYTYRFADADSREQFLQDPARWGVQGSGDCLLAPGTPVDPGVFQVWEGRIYAFAGRGCVAKFQDDPGYWVNKPEYEERAVAVLVYPGVDLLQFAGPAEIFTTAAQGHAFHVYTVAETPTAVTSQGFVTIQPEYTIENAPPPDILIVAGGGYGSVVRSPKMLEWIKARSESSIVLSVDTGAVVLAFAGVLDGQQVTTHHGSIDSLKRRASKSEVHADRRFVDNGNLITAAGGSAGIDAALHLVRRLLGPDRALGVARMLEYEWTPDESLGLVLQASQKGSAPR